MEALFGVKDHVDLWQECTRAGLVFCYGLVMLRLSGRRTFAQFSALDMVVSFITGSALSRALTGGAPLLGTLAAVAVLVALHVAVGHAIARSARLSRLVEGPAVLIGANGRVFEPARRAHMISAADIAEALRGAGIQSAGEAECIHLEPNGRLSVIRKT